MVGGPRFYEAASRSDFRPYHVVVMGSTHRPLRRSFLGLPYLGVPLVGS